MSANNPNLGGAGGLGSKRDSTLNNDLDGKSISDSYGDGRGSISDESDDDGGAPVGRRVVPSKRRKGDGDEIEEEDLNEDEEDEEQSYRR
jgi:hypothetical protein